MKENYISCGASTRAALLGKHIIAEDITWYGIEGRWARQSGPGAPVLHHKALHSHAARDIRRCIQEMHISNCYKKALFFRMHI